MGTPLGVVCNIGSCVKAETTFEPYRILILIYHKQAEGRRFLNISGSGSRVNKVLESYPYALEPNRNLILIFHKQDRRETLVEPSWSGSHIETEITPPP
jgi:hypothetical protein